MLNILPNTVQNRVAWPWRALCHAGSVASCHKSTGGLVEFLSGDVFFLYSETRYEQMCFLTVHFCVADFIDCYFTERMDLWGVSHLTLLLAHSLGFASSTQEGIRSAAWSYINLPNTVCISWFVFMFWGASWLLRISFTCEETFGFSFFCFSF